MVLFVVMALVSLLSRYARPRSAVSCVRFVFFFLPLTMYFLVFRHETFVEEIRYFFVGGAIVSSVLSALIVVVVVVVFHLIFFSFFFCPRRTLAPQTGEQPDRVLSGARTDHHPVRHTREPGA